VLILSGCYQNEASEIFVLRLSRVSGAVPFGAVNGEIRGGEEQFDGNVTGQHQGHAR